MNARNRTLVLGTTVATLILGACGGPVVTEAPEAEVSSELQTDAGCYAFARARVPAWTAAGLSTAEVDRRYRLAVAACADKDIDSATAVYVGAVNVDYERLARLMIAKSLTPNDYLVRMRDRSRKARIGRNDSTWTAAYVTGDEDGDLVPNSRDRCLGTKDLAPTRDDGCPAATEPAGRVLDADLVHRVIDKIGVMRSAACDGAPLPTVPEPVELRYTGTNLDLEIEMSKVTNQPAGCMVFYEILAEQQWFFPLTDQYGNITQVLTGHNYQRMAFKDVEALVAGPERMTFQIPDGSTGKRQDFREGAYGWGTRWQIRAINGNGLASTWSGVKSKASSL